MEPLESLERITIDPEVMGGRPCIRGLRLTVSLILRRIANGSTFPEILDDYPYLEREDLRQAVEYAAQLTQEKAHAH